MFPGVRWTWGQARADTQRLGPAYRATGARGFGGRKNRRNVGVTACRPACAFDCGTTGPQEWRRPSGRDDARSEEHTSELQSLMRTSYAVFCLKKKKHQSQT